MKSVSSIRIFFKKLGPGIVTGAADDDPSGIATYSQTGAQFGYALLWTALFMLPLQVAVQEACARIGAVKETGLAAVIRHHYNKKILTLAVLLVFIANSINIGADILAMAAAANLIIALPIWLFIVFFTMLMLVLQIFLSYQAYIRVLKWLCISLLAYPLTILIVNAPWKTILYATFIPTFKWDYNYLFILTGLLGTTISPYLFFWQASHVKEHLTAHNIFNKKGEVIEKNHMTDIRIDNFIGMFSSELAAWAIIVVAATILHSSGVTNIETAADAARALEPLVNGFFPDAGFAAKVIFAFGIIGLGLISVPVLAGSSAYAVGEELNLKVGLHYKYYQAKGFYGLIILSTLFGLSINFFQINPIKALVYTAVINGIVAVPLILLIALIARNKKIMGKYKSGPLSEVFVWLTFLLMGFAALGMFISFFK